MFKDGRLYTNDSETYNNFFGVQYESYITPVFSKPEYSKKTWQSLEEISTEVWDVPIAWTNVKFQNGQRQETNMTEGEFIVYENNPTASFKRNIFSRGGKWNGDIMKGQWIAVKMRRQNATNLITLNMAITKFVDSPISVPQ